MSQLNLILLGWRDPRAATESNPESRAKPAVEAAIDDGIVHGGAHGQPEDRQVDLLDELVAVDVLLEASFWLAGNACWRRAHGTRGPRISRV